MKLKMMCSECKGEDILADAYASWNKEKQEWELENVSGPKGAFCNDCENETKIEEKEFRVSVKKLKLEAESYEA